MRIGLFIFRGIVFVILTVISQIGGLIYLASLFIAKKLKYEIKAKSFLIFISLYSISTFLVVPMLAPVFGREKINNTEIIKPVNYLTIILNRNYVNPELHSFLISISEDLGKKDDRVKLRYLDAGFPFVSGFPLLPHLSHNDGKKIDLSLVYEDKEGIVINKSKSISGYGVFEEPKNNEFHQTRSCIESGYFQYDYSKYLSFGEINRDLRFSEKGTRILLHAILKQEKLEKLFIEPHLKSRLKLNDVRIRFQGCRAVRHDDHIHVQIK